MVKIASNTNLKDYILSTNELYLHLNTFEPESYDRENFYDITKHNNSIISNPRNMCEVNLISFNMETFLDYITFENPVKYILGDIIKNFSIETWIKFDSIGNMYLLFINDLKDNLISLRIREGKIRFYTTIRDELTVLETDLTYNDGNIHQILVTVNYNIKCIYVDGVLVKQDFNGNKLYSLSECPIYFGSSDGEIGNYGGNLYILRMYRRPLNRYEVMNNYIHDKYKYNI
jgi:hypothetical protein